MTSPHHVEDGFYFVFGLFFASKWAKLSRVGHVGTRDLG